MCGIAGVASLNENHVREDVLHRMARVLEHRGPDDEGFYLSKENNPATKLKVGLGHKRLSIIDIDTGHQPMTNADKSLWIVYNGEVYNFQEIREDLIKKNHRFYTRSDTEVILRLYEEKGIDCLNDLRGMFSFCIWDVKNEKLFLARDRVGQKPLFYYSKNGKFIFGSEIKAILEHDDVARRVDTDSLDDYLTYGYVPPPGTMFRDIRQLSPAHYLIFDGRETKIKRYWQLKYDNKLSISLADSEERLYELLGEATRLRLISDVPLGAFLSGGVDSSCIVALMSKFSSGKVKTFSIGFKEADFNELRYAKAISERFGTEHKELIVQPKVLEILPKIAWHYDQPFGDSSCIPTYYVSKMTREFVTVALNGDGGDESFAGYHRYKGMKFAQSVSNLPAWLLRAFYRVVEASGRTFIPESKSVNINHARRFFEPLMKKMGYRDTYMAWLNYFTSEDKAELYSRRIQDMVKGRDAGMYLGNIIRESDAKDIVEKIMNADVMSYLPEDLLVKVDRATMANSLEGRSPFLDHKVMEFAASLPLKYKLNGSQTKYILKRAFAKDIPLSFLNRKKKGFGVPVGRWFSGELSDFVREMLLSTRTLKKDIFSRDYLTKLISEHDKGKRDHTHRIWALLSFEMWHRTFIDREPL